MKNLPRIPIAHLPTPIEELPRLSEALGGPRLWVKRDDQTGLAFGGNKTRKLEYLAAEAQAQGALTLITAGAVQSNHCRQTAAAAAKLGFECILVLAGDPSEASSANYLLDRLLGVEVLWANWESRHDDLQRAYERAVKDGREPYLVPYGGSSPTGAAAYAYAIEEMLAQDLDPDWIIFASSSGGTHAGLVAGAHLCGYQGKVLGISIDEPEEILQARVATIASDVTKLLGEPTTFSPESVLVNADYLGLGYGIPSYLEKEAIQVFARHEALLLDPVYTGRVAGGMMDLISKEYFSPDETVLFWHTGGTPALFADKYRQFFA
ncbi:MAG: D-cysteine desulfhydrase family protein [Chloroflexi bacterium]|nr:D-cysteine desulfhydrase family protein [Chloroflexota bacterium]